MNLGRDGQATFNLNREPLSCVGNLTLDQCSYTYYYDYENHLTQIKEDATVKAAHTYDGPGRRAPAEIADDGKVETCYNYIHGNYLDEKGYG